MPQQRYRILEKIASGGMAEVFKGEVESIQGFKKQVAIKRVLPHLAQNRKFMAMFLDEARLSLRLNHANIVQVFDIGVADNSYFIVMEYVEGINLKTLMEHMNKRRSLIPIEQSVYILIEVLKGLSYAHELTTPEGNPLNIVHRDVSPPNVLISKRGEVKLTDFGLAKAVTQLEHTDPGIVKGKFSYLAPEVLYGLEVDSRADIFAAGILLFELTTGRRLFLGENDYQTIQLIKEAVIPSPSKINPSIPKDLEAIIYKALEKDRVKRYQTAREFGDDLAHFLFAHGLKVTGFDLANLVSSILQEELKQKRKREPSIIDQLIQEELLKFTSLDEMSDPLSLAGGAKPLSPEELSYLNIESDGEPPDKWLSSIEEKPNLKEEKLTTEHELATVLEKESTTNGVEYKIVEKSSNKINLILKIIFVILLLTLLGIAGATAHVLGYL